MRFLKYEAAGNDFLLIEEKNAAITPELIKRSCDRHFGIGADGAIIEQSAEQSSEKSADKNTAVSKARPSWLFYNSDGSEAEFCGNAARAFSLYLLEKNPTLTEVEFETRIGTISGRKSELGDLVVDVPVAPANSKMIPANILNLIEKIVPHFDSARFWDSGVPHLVLGVTRFPSREMRSEIARALYFHPQVPAGKWNITWYHTTTSGVVTFERGLERETLACGSGALACFLDVEYRGHSEATAFRFPGGLLKVARKSSSHLQLTGPARKVFSGEFIQ
jgi:diaminopimelate epimerase